MKKRKIKIFAEEFKTTLEYEVNRFIEEHEVVDIQYRYAGDDYHLMHSVMIVYEEW